MKKWVKIVLLTFIISLLLTSMYFIISSFDQGKNKKEIIYSYNIDQDLSYTVDLFDNSYIDTTTLGEDETYISDLIDNINIEYKYIYSSSEIVSLEYDYNVVATISGVYSLNEEDEKVWTKKYEIVEPTIKSITNSNMIVESIPVSIDYSFYDEVVSQFRQELKLPIEASLNVALTVNIKGAFDGNSLSDTKVLSVDIPLNQQAFKIDKNFESNYKKDIEEKSADYLNIDKKSLIIGIILLFIAILLFACSFKQLFNRKKKTNYTIKLNKLLKEYGDIIVEVLDSVVDEDMEIVEVKNFNEMIDLENELRVPIIFYETKKYYEGEFILVHNDIAYKYVLRDSDSLD